MRILFSRSGGGLPGLDIHCGIWQALTDSNIHSTDCIGTSAGAIISALDAMGYPAERIISIMRNLGDGDVISKRFMWKLRLFFMKSFADPAGARRILEWLTKDANNDLRKTLTVIANKVQGAIRTDFGFSVGHQSSSLVQPIDAVMASMSICGVFPWTTIGGIDYSDGGTAANLPLPMDWREYDQVYLLIATRPTAFINRDSNAFSRLLLNLDFYAMDQIADALRETAGAPNVHVIWPDVDASTSSLHFNHDLIRNAYNCTLDILKKKP